MLRETYAPEYVGDYEEFIASDSDLPSTPRVILATRCPVFKNGAFGISPTIVAVTVITLGEYAFGMHTKINVFRMPSRTCELGAS